MAVDQPFGSLVASRLLVRQHCEHEVTWSATGGVCLEKCADHHRDSALHVESTPAPEVAVDDLSAERPMAPVLVESRDHVHVALEQKRRCFTTALESRHQVRAPGSILISRALDVSIVEDPLDERDRDVLLAWRIRGVELDELPGQTDDEGRGLHHGQCSPS